MKSKQEKPKLPCSRPVAPIRAAEATGRNKHTYISPSPSLSIPFLLPALLLPISLRPTVCLPCPLSFAVTSQQSQHGSLVYSQTERGLIISCPVQSCQFGRPFRFGGQNINPKNFWLQLASHTQCFTDRTAIVIVTTLALSPFPTALPEHKQFCRNFQTRTQFAHYLIVLFRSVHSLKTTTGSNDCETL